jgi:hypothetical protein
MQPEAILHRRFRSLAAELEASQDPDAAAASDPMEPGQAPANGAPGGAPTPMATDAPEPRAPEPGSGPSDTAAAAPADGAAPASEAAQAGGGDPERAAVQRRILDHILGECIYHPRAEVGAPLTLTLPPLFINVYFCSAGAAHHALPAHAALSRGAAAPCNIHPSP